MARIVREKIYQAFFELVSANPMFKTRSRVLQHIADMQPRQLPAIFSVQRNELPQTDVETLPNVWMFYVDVYLYTYATDNTPWSEMNDLIDWLCELMNNREQDYQTLGGLVYDCAIDGTIETDEGSLNKYAVAIVPVKITVVS